MIRLSLLQFRIQAITPIGYAAFAFALGVTAGALIRRTVPAMAVTLAIFAALQVAMPLWVRPATSTTPAACAAVGTGPAGVRKGTAFGPGQGPAAFVACLASHGIREAITYQPASRYWRFQPTETAIYLCPGAGPGRVLLPAAQPPVLNKPAPH